MEAAGKLSNMQIELLKLFQYDLPEKQLLEIKNILAKYFASSATDEMDKLWDENDWDNETMKSWANEHLRNQDDSLGRCLRPGYPLILHRALSANWRTVSAAIPNATNAILEKKSVH